jgi:hypothetical protein
MVYHRDLRDTPEALPPLETLRIDFHYGGFGATNDPLAVLSRQLGRRPARCKSPSMAVHQKGHSQGKQCDASRLGNHQVVPDDVQGRELINSQGRIRTGIPERVLYLRSVARVNGIAEPISVVGSSRGLIEVRQNRVAPIDGEVGIGTRRINYRKAADARRGIAVEIRMALLIGTLRFTATAVAALSC